MRSTFETRFDVNPELPELLLDNASHWSWRLVFAHLSATRTQSTKVLADVQWKNVARALGKNRIVWGENFKRWFQHRVESASLSDTGRPLEEISMEMKNGSQPRTSRTLGGASTDALFGKNVDRLHKQPVSGFVH